MGPVPLVLLCISLVFSIRCEDRSVDQCTNSNCECQRISCCCGTGCPTAPQYNRCVNASSAQSTWGCPCAANAAPCTSNNPIPTSSTPSFQFGVTFPMIGTQPLSHQTWQQNVYMGTSMSFNPGSYFNYANSYNVPNFNLGQVDENGNPIPPPSAPTPERDWTGTPCFSYSQPCPTGYYCKLNPGYNIQQKGTCARVASDYWTGGAGAYTSSDFYNSLAHPPLVLDPNHLGAAQSGNYNGFSSVPGFISGSAAAESCASPSVCGYKAAVGSCWCDAKCQNTGDCCADLSRYCGGNQPYSSPAYSPPATSPAYSPPATTSSQTGCIDDRGACSSQCGSPAPVTLGSQTCYCDAGCKQFGDCCCGAC